MMTNTNKATNGTRPNNPSEGAWNCDLCGATNVHGKKGAICGCGESRKRNQPKTATVDLDSIELTW
jgi:hypothetical protein